jgi:Cytochrome C oxidase, cbb3-type, subunit III
MRAPAFVILVLLVAFSSCNSADTANGPTGGGQLPTTTYSIDPSKDTVLKTPGGALLRISAGTFDAGDAKTVNLEVKEAYTRDEMNKGSLSVHVGDTALSSGGVIFVQLAAGQSVSIQKAFGVSIPASTLQTNMQVYKGRLDDNGIVNWGEPQSLEGNPGLKELENGKAVYLANCASCHHLKGNLTGPSLAFLLSRRDRRWLLDYSRNNVRLLWRGDPYSCFLFNRYKMSPMPTFPDLSDADLEGVYRYVTSASKSLGVDSNAVADLRPGFDSCARNDAKCSGVIEKMASMPAGDTTRHGVAAGADADYYTFSIDKHGWYNVAAAGGDGKVAVDSAAIGTGESLEALQSCPCWCNVDAYRKADSIARALPAK